MTGRNRIKRLLFTLIIISIASAASAYEYRLQFSIPAGGHPVSVVGYYFVNNNVGGVCSYYTQGGCSGRGCHPPPPTYYYNTCSWDLYGNLLTTTPGAPATPASPLYTVGTETVYASGFSTTGRDSRNFGFVNTPSSHYTWQTPNGGYADISDAPYTIEATLISDGDYTLNVSGATVTPQVYGIYTTSGGSANITGNTCQAVWPGATCTVTISYDPTTIPCTGSPYGFAYTGIDMSLTSDSGGSADFTQRFTVTGLKICDDG
jgi:hypothetical protein